MITHEEAIIKMKEVNDHCEHYYDANLFNYKPFADVIIYIAQQQAREEVLEKVRWNLAFCIEDKNKLMNKNQPQEQRLKKVEELLELYKSVHGVVQSWDTVPNVQSQIDKLEKELKENE